MATPSERFLTGRVDSLGPALDARAMDQDRSGEDWVNRTVSANGTISVSHQVFSVGKHRGGMVVDIHVRDELLEVWDQMELVKSVLRTSKGVVRKKKAEYHHFH